MGIMDIIRKRLADLAEGKTGSRATHPHDEDARRRVRQVEISRGRVRFVLTTAGVARVFRKRPFAAWKGGV